MSKIFVISLLCVVASANSLPLVHYDPFYKSQIILRSHTHKRAQRKPFALSAIFNHRAFINNKFYTIGEKIQGYKIKKIYKNSVVLQHGSIMRVLHLQKKHLLQIKQAKREKK